MTSNDTARTIDVTPSPKEYARIARFLLANTYPAPVAGLTDYQVLWAWNECEISVRRIGEKLHELPNPLVRELARLYVGRAAKIKDYPLTEATTYAELNAIPAQ
jgi:hypothetical protein